MFSGLPLFFSRFSALRSPSSNWRAAPTATLTSSRSTTGTVPLRTNLANTAARTAQQSSQALTIHFISGFAPTMSSVVAASRWPGSPRLQVGDHNFIVEISVKQFWLCHNLSHFFIFSGFSLWRWINRKLWQYQLPWLPWELPSQPRLLLDCDRGSRSAHYFCLRNSQLGASWRLSARLPWGKKAMQSC